jgi:hypothetical protein
MQKNLNEEQLHNFLFTYGILDGREKFLELFDAYVREDLTRSDFMNRVCFDFGVSFDRYASLIQDLQELLQPQQEVVPVPESREKKSLEKALKELSKKHTSKNLASRFEKAAVSYLKGVRNDLKVFDVLMRSKGDGGLEMKQQDADAVIQILQEMQSQYTQEEIAELQGVSQSGKVEDLALDVDDKLEAIPHRLYGDHQPIEHVKEFVPHVQEHIEVIEEKKELPAPEQLQELHNGFHQEMDRVFNDKEVNDAVNDLIAAITEGEHEHEKNIPRPPRKKEPTHVPQEISQLIEEDVAQVAPSAPQKPMIKTSHRPPEKLGFFQRLFGVGARVQEEMRNPFQQMDIQVPAAQPATSQRPMMQDVKAIPKLFTPIDELEALDATDFRRLSKDPYKAIEKIQQKIDLLEKDSLIKRGQGIAALKKSALYAAYSSILHASLTEGVSYQEALTKQTTLTLDEFSAIMQLNKRLRV